MNSLKNEQIQDPANIIIFVYVYIPFQALFKMLDSIGIIMTIDQNQHQHQC